MPVPILLPYTCDVCRKVLHFLTTVTLIVLQLIIYIFEVRIFVKKSDLKRQTQEEEKKKEEEEQHNKLQTSNESCKLQLTMRN